MAVVRRARLRDFRGHAHAHAELGAGLTILHGPNGAGKTNLLEALYFGLTGRSCRTSADRELVRFDADATRVELDLDAPDGAHQLAVGYERGGEKHLTADGARVERLLDVGFRPLVVVFLPDRLELVKGAPAVRRAHVDQLVAGLWPSRAIHRRSYAQSLAQRNALLGRVRAGAASAGALDVWDLELGRHAIALRETREAALALVDGPFAEIAGELGLAGEAALRYRPRSQATEPEAFAAELAERRGSDLERGFTGHGPHRDELQFVRDGRELRLYGSQGEQRLALLSLLLAERDALAAERDAPPLLLLDDVLSELDAERRARLIARAARVGQVVLTATEASHVPDAAVAGATVLDVTRDLVPATVRHEAAA